MQSVEIWLPIQGSQYQSGQITFMKIRHEIISNVILLLPLIQKGQLSVTGNSIPILDTATKFVIPTIWLVRKPSLKRWQLIINYAVALLFNTSRNICFGYLLESPHWGNSTKYPKHMVYKEIKLNMAFVAYPYTHWEFFTTANSF